MSNPPFRQHNHDPTLVPDRHPITSLPPPARFQQSYGQVQHGTSYAPSAHTGPQQHPPPISSLPPYPQYQELFPQGQRMPGPNHITLHNQSQGLRLTPAPAPSTPVHAQQTRRSSDTSISSSNDPRQIQRHPNVTITIDDSSLNGVSNLNHAMMNAGITHPGLQRAPWHRQVQGLGGEALQRPNHIPGKQQDPKVSYPGAPVNGVVVTQGNQTQMPIPMQTFPQNQVPTQGRPYIDHVPSSQQSQPQITPQQFMTGVSQTAASIQSSPSDQQLHTSGLPFDVVQQAADRHAVNILARTYSSLKASQETLHRVLRDELMNMNRKYINDLSLARGAVYNARKAEHEAKEKQGTALRTCEGIISKAMEWKKSLEDTRRKYAALQLEHAKLAHLALHQNKLLSADSSATSIAALKDRVSYLEGRLQQYENVPTSPIETGSLITTEDQSNRESSSSSPTVQTKPFSFDKASATEEAQKSNLDRRRLQNEVNIVSELVERKQGPGSPTSVATEPVKGECLTMDGETKLLHPPYIIDLTVDTPDQDGAPLALLSHDHSQPTQELETSTASGVQTLPVSLDSTQSSDFVPFAKWLLAPDVNALKRGSGRDADDDREPKRPRKEDEPPPQARMQSSNAREGPSSEEVTEVLNKTENKDTSSDAPILNGLDSDGSDIGKDETFDDKISAADNSGKEFASNLDQLPELDAMHLQLIYHKYESGDSECRFCLIEIDDGTREPDKVTVFPATAMNEELVSHAVRTHYTNVSHLLQLERTELLAAFSKIMEAV